MSVRMRVILRVGGVRTMLGDWDGWQSSKDVGYGPVQMPDGLEGPPQVLIAIHVARAQLPLRERS